MASLYTISGPRGVGKTSLMEDLCEKNGIRPIVPYTTRDPRDNEIEGRDYHFVTENEFNSIRRTKGMFDVLTLRGKMYGTPLEEFDTVVNNDSTRVDANRIINIAAASALELRRELGLRVVKSIFLLPACWNDIDEQMRAKGISEEQILERRSSEPTDLTMLPHFDHIAVNPFGERESTYKNILGFVMRTSNVRVT